MDWLKTKLKDELKSLVSDKDNQVCVNDGGAHGGRHRGGGQGGGRGQGRGGPGGGDGGGGGGHRRHEGGEEAKPHRPGGGEPGRRPGPAGKQCIPDTAVATVANYSYMYWKNGQRDKNNLVVAVQTSRYGFELRYNTLELLKFGALPQRVSEAFAVNVGNDMIQKGCHGDACITFGMIHNGVTYTATGTCGDFNLKNRLIEHGRWFNRRIFDSLTWSTGTPAMHCSSIEVSAWPDRVAFTLHATPQHGDCAETHLFVKLSAPGLGAAFTIAGSCGASVEDGTVTSRPEGSWLPMTQRSVTLVAYFNQAEKGLTDLSTPITVKADQTVPQDVCDLPVRYVEAEGWHEIVLRNDKQMPLGDQRWNRIERVLVTVSNSSDQTRIVRLCFTKTKDIFLIIGILATLHDTDLNPIGIPIQVSKNWDSNPKWYRGLVALEIPAGATWSMVYTTVNAFWGGAPSATHVQLALTNAMPTTQWDQAAISCWGENFCYEPDQGRATRAAVLDMRPLYILGSKGKREKFGWTQNVGGADFCSIETGSPQRQFNVQMRTYRKRQGPLLTETTYAGKSQDNNLRLQYTACIARSDDAARAIYHLRIDVVSDVKFRRFPIWQMGTPTYAWGYNNHFAYGDEKRLIREWTSELGQVNGKDGYRTQHHELKGTKNWVSFTQSPSCKGKGHTDASRGFAISDWSAVLDGKPACPFMAERGLFTHGSNAPNGQVSIIEVLPPPSVTCLKAGDYIDCIIEQIMLPKFCDEYYGTNANMQAALEKMENSWRLMYREVALNTPKFDVQKGKRLRQCPLMIQVDDTNHARFSVTGGLGYLAMTFAGATGFKNPKLETRVDGCDDWTVVNQAVHGKDFWQADFDPSSSTWELTYSVSVDNPCDEVKTRWFRFHVLPCATLSGIPTWKTQPIAWPTRAALGPAVQMKTC